jgi:N-acyl-D-aspartate/D-glutamate deacylase
MHDLVIRNGRVVDGTGAPEFVGDVAVSDGVITDVGVVDGRGRREIDADGLVVTPGVVDIHTHYDGQAMWDPDLTPSCWHGVTTAVIGNCSVGFAPCAPDRRDWLIDMMESVEDIPASALRAGLDWSWETFPEYLDALGSSPRSIDIGTQVPHAALRAYVMGERGARDEPATADDIAMMSKLVEDGIAAGALGFSTSRTVLHYTADRVPIPGTYAHEDELFGIGDALARAGSGVFEVVPSGVAGEDVESLPGEVDWMTRLAARIGRPVCMLLTQNNTRPDAWRDVLAAAEQAQRDGAMLVVQVAGRPGGLIAGLGTTYHVLDRCPTFAAGVGLSKAEQVARLRDPSVRAAIVAEAAGGDTQYALRWDRMFPFIGPVDYEPAFEQSVAGIAAARGVSPVDVILDLTIDDPDVLFAVHVLNYADGTADALREMLTHPATVLGLADGGAHVATICDASMPTSMLTMWARDRRRGEPLPLEFVVRRQTRDTAALYGLHDRGVIAPGKLGDLNVIDYERLTLRNPEFVNDLPAGAPRLLQRADGYVATIKNGVPVLEHDELTGARPAGVVRGARSTPDVRPA